MTRILMVVGISAGFCPPPVQAGDRSTEGVIVLDMSEAHERIDAEEVKDALSLRLPGWSIVQGTESADSDVQCPTPPNDAYLLRILSSSRNRVIVELVSCENDKILLRERMTGEDEIAESPRRVAVLVPLALAVQEETPKEAAPSPTTDSGLFDRTSPVGVIGLSPGLTVAPSAGKAVFLGSVELGLLLVNGLAFRFTVDGSTPYNGVTDKKNLDPEDQVQVSVTDVAFRLLALYRFELGRRWYVALGLGLRYTHAIIRDRSDNKFEIEEGEPSSRGAGVAVLEGGVMIRRWFSLFLELLPAVSFGRRTYSARGSEAVDLGYATIGLTLGVRFYL